MKKITAVILCAALLLALAVPLAGAQAGENEAKNLPDKAVRGQERAQEARERARQWQEQIRSMRELAQQIRLQREEIRELQAEITNLRMRLREMRADKPQPDERTLALVREHMEAIRRYTGELRGTAGNIRQESQGLQLGRYRQDPEAVENHLNRVLAVQQNRIVLLEKIAAELQALLDLVAGAGTGAA